MTFEVCIISHVANDPLVMEALFKTSYISHLWTFPSATNETSCRMPIVLSHDHIIE